MNFTEFKEQYKNLNSKNQQQQFIDSRLDELIKSTPNKKIGKNQCGSYRGFIGPNVELFPNGSGLFPGLVLDDMNIYESFLNFIDNDVESYLYGEPATIKNIQIFIWNYFGPNSGDSFSRMDFYSTPDMKPVSIKEFKGNNMAACSERSAVVQNLLQFMGWDSEIIFGNLNTDSSHAYVIFTPENGNFKLLYDPMNPVVFTDGEKKEYGAAISKLSEEEYNALKSGEKYKFDYSLSKKIYGKEQCLENDRIYGCDDHLYKNDINVK